MIRSKFYLLCYEPFTAKPSFFLVQSDGESIRWGSCVLFGTVPVEEILKD